MEQESICISFKDNTLLTPLFGAHDKHLQTLEQKLNIEAISRGNKIALQGQHEDIEKAEKILESLYQRLEMGFKIDQKDVEAAIRMVSDKDTKEETSPLLINTEIVINTLKKKIVPHTNRQKEYITQLFNKEMVFSKGPAGTGKTYLAVAVAVSMFLDHKVDKLILCRPALEAGEKIGFLPGDIKEKIDPFLRPLYDALHDMLPSEKVFKYLENETFEIAPLAFMRGRTLNNAFILLDEAQNATPIQMKMFLTRLGENSRMAINGDLSQIDLPPGETSGLADAIDKLKHLKKIGMVSFNHKDVVRHHLVADIIKAYDKKS